MLFYQIVQKLGIQFLNKRHIIQTEQTLSRENIRNI